MRECITREAALAALRKYNQEPFHLQHALTVEAVMGWYAEKLGYGAEMAANAGIPCNIRNGTYLNNVYNGLFQNGFEASFRHSARKSVLWFDGHVSQVRYKEVNWSLVIP